MLRKSGGFSSKFDNSVKVFLLNLHDRESALPYKGYITEPSVVFDLTERYGGLESFHRLQINYDPSIIFGGRILIVFPYNFGYTYDFKPLVAVVEKDEDLLFSCP